LRAFKKEYGITPKEFYKFMISKEKGEEKNINSK
jgi:AraC-like DNA-binding protein